MDVALSAGDIPIIQYWHEPTPPDDVALLIRSVRLNNPDRRYILFNEHSAVDFIEEHFTAREVRAFRTCADHAMQADYLRYCVVLTLGGVYLDVDFRCIGSFTPLISDARAGKLFQKENGPIINSCFIFTRVSHPLLELVIECATTNIERRMVENVWLTTGPFIFTWLYDRLRHGSLELEQGPLAKVQAPLLDVVGNYARLERVFADVRISPYESSQSVVESAGQSVAYKRGDTHWHRRTASIFK